MWDLTALLLICMHGRPSTADFVADLGFISKAFFRHQTRFRTIAFSCSDGNPVHFLEGYSTSVIPLPDKHDKHRMQFSISAWRSERIKNKCFSGTDKGVSLDTSIHDSIIENCNRTRPGECFTNGKNFVSLLRNRKTWLFSRSLKYFKMWTSYYSFLRLDIFL